MTIREVRADAERRSPASSQHIEALAAALTLAAASDPCKVCAVCGAATRLPPQFVIPVTYIAACLIDNHLADAYPLLPLRRAALCKRHRGHFGALFVDIADSKWDVERLERRAEVLGGVPRDTLLVFGGAKALTIVDEFHAGIAALERRLKI